MELQCPMPKFDFDVITLGHGSGGILTHQLLNSGVFALLANPLLDEKHDGAVFEANGKIAFSADSYVVSPIFFPGGNIGELAINGTVNDLAMCGAAAKYLSLSFIIEEGLPMTDFWKILNSIQQAASDANVHIVTGDTKVVEKGKGDGIFINTSGIGFLHPEASIHVSNIKKGDKIIISGNIASHGVAIMSLRQGLEFESDIISDTANLNHTVIALLDKFGQQIHFLRDPTRGGVATVLNEIAKDSNTGVNILQNKLPVDEGVSSACEILGLDPLYVANEGIFIAIVAVDVADDFVTALKQLPFGANATTIGEITDQHPKQVILKSSIGGSRVVSMLPGEQLPRIC
ncbi:hydrogenase expression/formation protein HypE [Ferruginibacter paludis]|uniref:hydrogenase expression/formation protein HypE n=1 Tax=Ferruginibacter paludis TaxID=1310417 RepID=UPI0025B587E3|nr:hydrogenase expression/formation protein HypE [Ferruginibacter paludis]MDN3656534.1 hydrogenase expression/formation protein HypE [Ferruginibacter paludis]